ncbi:hypothetical protein UFOVP181_376 [uncultured Caudovirales phage]|uniref:Uncharacterized protein n=1 Tax=uncultured Caudovirales phage TaxID=2100421 RepID=A0A6J5KWX7_9CAUD|nr:hypothetical protein UFOVP57_263 [uncultured Caudovirales phage]CAB5209237.1 hypothetical protein UFOVP181_376 [uncultured Caudovirales phage]
MNNLFLNKFINTKNLSSSEFIQSSDLKNKFIYPYLPTIVVDNFYEDPILWREFALGQEFFKGNRGNWPGLRTELLHNLNYDLFQITLKKILFVLKDYGITKVSELQTGFQLIDDSYGRGWVHDDDPTFQYAGVIYLSKDAPIGTGTTIYEDSVDFNGDQYNKMFETDVNNASPEEREIYAKYRAEQVASFKKSIVVENVFNRLVLFDSRCWHSADNFFGTTKDDTRLTQVFFIKT